jgi:hypothetical protein
MLLACSTAAALAQPRDFSGTWEQVIAPDAKGEVKEVLVIKQDKNGMTATFTPEGKSSSEVVRLEFGTTARQTPPVGSRDVEASIATSWKGDVLVTVNTITVQGKSRTFEQQWAIESGNQLAITTVRTVAGKPQTTRTVYKRRGATATR